MSIAVRRFRETDAGAVERLNERLEAGGSEHRLYPEDLFKNPTADLEVRPVHHSLFVAADDQEIRGGAWLREQYFWVDGARHRVGWMKYPVSESLVNPEFAGVPASMVLQFLRQQPLLMALGMGGHAAPFARILGGIRWKSSTIPFRFRIVRPFRALRMLPYARRNPYLRIAMDLAAWSGAGWMAHRFFQATGPRMHRGLSITQEQQFTPWADAIWETCRGEYSALAVRDARTLDHLYPSTHSHLHRLRVARGGSDIGWSCAQLLSQTAENSSYFGDLKVGLITDVLARPVDAITTLGAAVRHLEEIGADLVVTYLSHGTWLDAARRLRFLAGPSTFAFYRAPGAERLLADSGSERAWHLTRSDGDGPKQ